MTNISHKNRMKNPFLIGKKIYLRALDYDDLSNLACWLNDEKVTYYLQQGDRPPTIEKLKEAYDVEGKNEKQIPFAVVDKKSNKNIGWTGLYEINWLNRTAEMRIFVGEKNFWRKGIAYESQKLVTEYGFDKLNLHRIFAGTNIECLGEQGALKKLFFTKEGISKEATYRNGKYYDLIHFAILKNQYRRKVTEGKWKKLTS